MRGKFIVFEGIDGSGKSTQCNELIKRLERENIPVKPYKFHNKECRTGALINNITSDKEISMNKAQLLKFLFIANRWECAEQLEDFLQKGFNVICDRYSLSGIAYGAATTDMKEKDLPYAIFLEKGLPRPDRVYHIDTPVDVALNRIDARGKRIAIFENKSVLEKVNSKFKLLSKYLHPEMWVTLNGLLPINTLSDAIYNDFSSLIISDELKRL